MSSSDRTPLITNHKCSRTTTKPWHRSSSRCNISRFNRCKSWKNLIISKGIKLSFTSNCSSRSCNKKGSSVTRSLSVTEMTVRVKISKVLTYLSCPWMIIIVNRKEEIRVITQSNRWWAWGISVRARKALEVSPSTRALRLQRDQIIITMKMRTHTGSTRIPRSYRTWAKGKCKHLTYSCRKSRNKTRTKTRNQVRKIYGK